jgi:hypothetical protein
MTNNITLESLHNDIVTLQHQLIRLEAKIDSKPSLMAMFSGIFVVVLVWPASSPPLSLFFMH